jgi:hypothetical protein
MSVFTPSGHWPSVRPHFPTSGETGYGAAPVRGKVRLACLFRRTTPRGWSKRVDAIYSSIAIGDEVHASSCST